MSREDDKECSALRRRRRRRRRRTGKNGVEHVAFEAAGKLTARKDGRKERRKGQ